MRRRDGFCAELARPGVLSADRSRVVWFVVALIVATGCGQTAETGTPATTGPTTQDAYRVAQAAADPALSFDYQGTARAGVIVPHAYVCADPTLCRPAEGWVTQEITPRGATRGQLARFYIDNLSAAGWTVEAAYCDEDKNEYAVVASKRTDVAKGYEGRFELTDKAKVEAKISVAAFGQENAFTVEPDASAYPAGPCPDTITQALARAQRDAAAASGTTSSSAPPP